MYRSQHIQIGAQRLEGVLALPAPARSLIVFAHGSGSSRLSPRNLKVAAALEGAGHATLLLDLLTPSEAALRELVFDIELLGGRVVQALDWADKQPELADLPRILYGASTGAAAALVAAARRPATVAGVVSRGGRPDLAEAVLSDVRAPVLLIVGALDPGVLELNRAAQARLRGEVELVLVPGAGHLFEEAGALEQVIEHTLGWLERVLP